MATVNFLINFEVQEKYDFKGVNTNVSLKMKWLFITSSTAAQIMSY